MWEIDPAKTAFITIDMQRAFLDEGAPRECPDGRDFVPRMNELAALCRSLEIPVIHVHMMTRPDLSDAGLRHQIRPLKLDAELEILSDRKGSDFYPGMDISEKDYIVPKVRYSAFIAGSSHLERLLHGLGRDQFMICGVATDVCVATTAIDAMMLDFKVFVIGDLTATFDEERQRVMLQLLDAHFARVMSFGETKERLSQLAVASKET